MGYHGTIPHVPSWNVICAMKRDNLKKIFLFRKKNLGNDKTSLSSYAMFSAVNALIEGKYLGGCKILLSGFFPRSDHSLPMSLTEELVET